MKNSQSTVVALKTYPLKKPITNLITESQHDAMKTMLNMRYLIQEKLKPWLGREEAKIWAIGIVMMVERPVKIILY